MDIFTIGVLNRVVAAIPPTQPSYLTDTFFPGVQQETGGDIHFDVTQATRRISPFVSPLVEGQLVERAGYKANVFSPAYVKDKRPFDANAPFRRLAGEPIFGNLTPEQRIRAMIAQETADQKNMLYRRFEVMASEILVTGGVTISGDKYPTVHLDFGRDAALRVTLAGGLRWGQAGVQALASLRAWARLVFSKSGVFPTRWIMTQDAYELFLASPDVQAIINRARANNTLDDSVAIQPGVFDAGSVGGFSVRVYNDRYIDPADNTEKDILPPFTVIAETGGMMEGYRAFAAIRDEAAGWQAMPFFTKSWVEQDPSVRYLMMQSAPLLVPYRPNASFAATVN